MKQVNIIIFFTFLISSINLIYTDLEVETYIKEKCEKLSGNFPNEFKQQEKTENETIGNFQIWKLDDKINPNKRNLLYKQKTSGNNQRNRRFFNIIHKLKEDTVFEGYFSELTKCYYQSTSSLGSVKFSQLFFLMKRSKINNIDTYNLSAQRLSYFKYEFKIYIFLQITRLFRYMRNEGFIGLNISLKDFRVNTKDNSIKLPASIFAEMTEIDRKEKDLSKIVDVNLSKFNEEYIKYVHPVLRKDQKNISIKMLEKSDLYNLGILFLEIFGIKISFVFKKYEEISILEDRVYASTRRYLGRSIKEKNSEYSPIPEALIEEISNYYLELFFRPTEKAYKKILFETDPSIVFVKKLEKEYRCDYQKNNVSKKTIVSESDGLEYSIYSDDPKALIQKSHLTYDLRVYSFKKNYLNYLVRDHEKFRMTHALHETIKEKASNIIEKFTVDYFEFMYISNCKVSKDMFYFDIKLLDGVMALNRMEQHHDLNILHKIILILNLAKTYKLFAHYNFPILNLGENNIFYSRKSDWVKNEFVLLDEFILTFTPKKFANILEINNSDESLKKELCSTLKNVQIQTLLDKNPDILNFCINDEKNFHQNFEVYNFARFAYNLIDPSISFEFTAEDIFKKFKTELKTAFETDEKFKKVSEKDFTKLNKLLISCLNINPKKRPDFDKIISEIEKFLKKYK